MCMFENMSQDTGQKGELFATQLRELILHFSKIDNPELAEQVIQMVKRVATTYSNDGFRSDIINEPL